MNVGMTIDEIKEKATPVLEDYKIEYAGVFGSVARGDSKPQSDIDIIVRVKHIPFGIWGMVGLKEDLEKALEVKVDLVSEQGISHSFASRIKRDLVTLYEKR